MQLWSTLSPCKHSDTDRGEQHFSKHALTFEQCVTWWMERFITVKGRGFRAPISLGEGMGKSHLLWRGKGMQKLLLAAEVSWCSNLTYIQPLNWFVLCSPLISSKLGDCKLCSLYLWEKSESKDFCLDTSSNWYSPVANVQHVVNNSILEKRRCNCLLQRSSDQQKTLK